jgi:hypothetical protein
MNNHSTNDPSALGQTGTTQQTETAKRTWVAPKMHRHDVGSDVYGNPWHSGNEYNFLGFEFGSTV